MDENMNAKNLYKVAEKWVELGGDDSDVLWSAELLKEYVREIVAAQQTDVPEFLLRCPQCSEELHNGFCQNCKAAFTITRYKEWYRILTQQ